MTKQEQYKKLKLQLESLTGKKVQLVKENVEVDLKYNVRDEKEAHEDIAKAQKKI